MGKKNVTEQIPDVGQANADAVQPDVSEDEEVKTTVAIADILIGIRSHDAHSLSLG